MSRRRPAPHLETELIETRHTVTLGELCIRCNTDAGFIEEMVSYGVIEPHGSVQQEWRFSVDDLLRLQRARRLQRDLALNPPGLALALDLLEEVNDLRRELAELEATHPLLRARDRS